MGQTKTQIGISSCLLGNKVRYDGSDKYCQHIADAFAGQFALIAFCPEMAIGLGVPRPPIRLVSIAGGVRLRGVEAPQQDVTRDILAYVQEVSPQLAMLSGYIFKSRSPSCGVADVPVYREDGSIESASASGLFAQAIQALLPDLPWSTEEALLEEAARTDFISRVLHYRQARQA
ncbi:DUF523 domain-containing protein [Sulfuriflexus mobilis]|uniref:DUF523 domain-containing protein n=1 Tax=Sulfuriflexus mobilis TaxID=1811807 RepID=UPI000F8201B1|nr:DUF523 domain-containing protein [Sulfuriflexus mobilis]